MKIQMLQLSSIKPYWRNARKNDNTIEQLKKSIAEFGFNQPLVLDANNTIIVGHARYKAVTQLGFTEVPCVISTLDEKTAKKYRIADNKIHETSIWDNDNLMIELREIGQFEDMQIYFPNIDLGNWLDESVGFNIKPTTQSEYDKKEAEMNTRFDANADRDAKINILCPHCLEEFELNKKAMLEALTSSLGIVSTACKKVGIARQTHYEWLRLDEDYKTEVKDIKNYAIDYVETQLFQCIKDKREASIIFYLKTQGKERGYVDRQEVDSGENNSFRIEIIDENNPNK